MLFNSIHFLLFLPVIFLLYWWLSSGRLRVQNALLLLASYYFYSCWDPRFLLLLVFSTLLDYYSGIKIERAETSGKRKFWLWLSIALNLGFLGVFKYFNFFSESFADALALVGLKVNALTLSVVLPVGISFYTFHGLSYVIDIYKKRIDSERDFINYSLFVSFFPLLVAGPIERATHLLPQIKKRREFDYYKAVDGCRQILWGFFKKVVIADNCAEYANYVFGNHLSLPGSTLFVGALFFTFQIYCDFSGYSDIALGTARLFGIELLKNFSFPYFSRDIAEFWRRWHISLSSWFRDYLYIPLGGSKGGLWMKIRNTFIIFLVSGFWHGANWTFLIWGGLNALYMIPGIAFNKNRDHLDIVANDSVLPSMKELRSMILTFSLTVLAWIFFRAGSVTQAFTFISKIFSKEIFIMPEIYQIGLPLNVLFSLIFFFILIEWKGRRDDYALKGLGVSWHQSARLSLYFVLLSVAVYAGAKEGQFIYFQF